mmetsp:Transcript_73783/g.108305  ORF Transcript_73783/g.108305 Transcript_73783/m.108305 type:complete len:200 (-) Transcript_73783:344-943(-)
MWEFLCPPSSIMTSNFPPDSRTHLSTSSGFSWSPVKNCTPGVFPSFRNLCTHATLNSAIHTSALGNRPFHNGIDAPAPYGMPHPRPISNNFTLCFERPGRKMPYIVWYVCVVTLSVTGRNDDASCAKAAILGSLDPHRHNSSFFFGPAVTSSLPLPLLSTHASLWQKMKLSPAGSGSTVRDFAISRASTHPSITSAITW